MAGAAWLVLPDKLTIRLFFDAGIVRGLEERLGDRLVTVLPSPEEGGEWAQRVQGRVLYRSDLVPIRVGYGERALRRIDRVLDRFTWECRRDTRASALGSRERRGRRCGPASHRALAAADRARRRARRGTRPRGARGHRRDSSRVRASDAPRGASCLRAPRGARSRPSVVNMPWLNSFDGEWLRIARSLRARLRARRSLSVGGLGDALRRAAWVETWSSSASTAGRSCGTPPEALRAHGLDGASLAARILEATQAPSP